MSSILTNTAAISALTALRQINKDLLQSQNRISTGLRVSSASDNAAYWSLATTLRSDNKALSAVKDSLGLSAATIDVAYTAVDTSAKVVDEIKAKLVAARSPGVDRGKIQKEIGQLQEQLRSTASAASFAGQNWVSVDSAASGYNPGKSLVASFTRQNGAVSVKTITIDTSATKLFDANDQSGILDADLTYTDSSGATQTVAGASVATIDISGLLDGAADLAILDSYIAGVDNAVSGLATAGTALGAAQKRVDLQKEFITDLSAALTRGIGQLVDADLAEEATRFQALQVRQQLAVQALSIANSSAQNILKLFQ